MSAMMAFVDIVLFGGVIDELVSSPLLDHGRPDLRGLIEVVLCNALGEGLESIGVDADDDGAHVCHFPSSRHCQRQRASFTAYSWLTAV